MTREESVGVPPNENDSWFRQAGTSGKKSPGCQGWLRRTAGADLTARVAPPSLSVLARAWKSFCNQNLTPRSLVRDVVTATCCAMLVVQVNQRCRPFLRQRRTLISSRPCNYCIISAFQYTIWHCRPLAGPMTRIGSEH